MHGSFISFSTFVSLLLSLSLFSFLSMSLYSRSLQTARRLLLIHWWWDKAAVGCTFSKLSARFSSSSDAQPPVFLSSQPLPGINSSILNPIPNPDYPVSLCNVSTVHCDALLLFYPRNARRVQRRRVETGPLAVFFVCHRHAAAICAHR